MNIIKYYTIPFTENTKNTSHFSPDPIFILVVMLSITSVSL